MWQRLAFVAVLLAAAHARLALYAGHGGAGTFGFGGILRFNNTAWTPVNMAGTVNSDLGIVYALAPGGAGGLYAGGVVIDGSNNVRTSESFVDYWNGTTWTTLTSEFCYSAISSPCPRGSVQALAVGPGNVLYAGGLFQKVAGNVTARSIAQWNGAAWAPLGIGLNGTVVALALQGGALYAGGSFTATVAGGPLLNVARWDGTTWNALGAGLPYVVNALAPFNGAMIAGGVGAISRWSGSAWTALSTVNGTVNALAVFNGVLYAAGSFVEIDSVAANSIARWDGTTWTPLSSGLESEFGAAVNALAVFKSQLYVAGSFSSAGGVPVARVAIWTDTRWTAPTPPSPTSVNERGLFYHALTVACDLGWTDATCATCAPGFTGAACTPCPSGTYKSTTGSAACTACPGHGSTGGVEGSTSRTQCFCLPFWTGPNCDEPVPLCVAGDTSVGIQVLPTLSGSTCIDVYNPQYRWLAQAPVFIQNGRAGVPTAALGGATSLIVEGYADSACTQYLSSFTCTIVVPTTPPPTVTPTATATPTGTCIPVPPQAETCCGPRIGPGGGTIGDGITHVHTLPGVRCVLSPAQYSTPYFPDASGNVNITPAGATRELELYADPECTSFLRPLSCCFCGTSAGSPPCPNACTICCG